MKKLIILTVLGFVTISVWGQTQIETSPIYYKNGKVGIGIADPLSILHINGFPYTYTGDPLTHSYAWGIDFSEENTPNNRSAYVIQRHRGLSFSAHSYYGGIRFYNQGSSPYGYNGTMVMSITNGKVGVGTINPSEKLEVKGGNLRISNSTSVAYGSLGQLDFHNSNSASQVVSARIEGKRDSYSHKDGRLSFYTSNVDGVLNEQMTIDRKGFVGFGTESPNYKLDVTSISRINNVFIGTSSPASGITIRANFPGYNGGWARAFYIANENGSERYIGLGSFGSSTNGVAKINYSYIGKAYNDAYMYFKPDGNIGIGTTNPGSYKLAVEGKIGAHEVVVTTDGWADFVFEDDYELMTLDDLKAFIQTNKHLPEIPTEKEVEENGISVGEMDAKLLQKIEELTLYTIEQQELIGSQQEVIKNLMNENITQEELIKQQQKYYKNLLKRIENLENN